MGYDYKPFASSRREYGDRCLDEESLNSSPLIQFEQWFAEAVSSEVLDPTAMVLSTVDARGFPNSRVVLLKGLEDGAFIFYTNYESAKSIELEHTPFAALNFYWAGLARQVRVRGSVQRVSRAASEAYFSSRSMMSQCSAIVSPQSRVISSRTALLDASEQLMVGQSQSSAQQVVCPSYWGGFSVLAEEIEFWQGRDHRLHDRILYSKKESGWLVSRLAS
ncbi:MAG: pyridoxamine 5'-phosphate oxidase [Gammaproteobacteria bacterium]|nr:pyridoxamine 5'-phosphate oxidase [Gammaproteobacteria bacterium]MCH9764214.1 pyridoxamine 5'-phosphate oxidase [Gammaproteobacteria bacterium]